MALILDEVGEFVKLNSKQNKKMQPSAFFCRESRLQSLVSLQ
jgi:hypothetical protein